VPAAGGEPEQLAQGSENEGARWSRDGTRAFFCRTSENGRNFWAVRVADGEEQQLTALKGKRGIVNYFAFATDGQYLYFIWEEVLGDIWVMDVVTDETE